MLILYKRKSTSLAIISWQLFMKINSLQLIGQANYMRFANI